MSKRTKPNNIDEEDSDEHAPAAKKPRVGDEDVGVDEGESEVEAYRDDEGDEGEGGEEDGGNPFQVSQSDLDQLEKAPVEKMRKGVNYPYWKPLEWGELPCDEELEPYEGTLVPGSIACADAIQAAVAEGSLFKVLEALANFYCDNPIKAVVKQCGALGSVVNDIVNVWMHLYDNQHSTLATMLIQFVHDYAAKEAEPEPPPIVQALSGSGEGPLMSFSNPDLLDIILKELANFLFGMYARVPPPTDLTQKSLDDLMPVLNRLMYEGWTDSILATRPNGAKPEK